jgi:hypothetical protein
VVARSGGDDDRAAGSKRRHSAARLLVASIRTPDLPRVAMWGVQDFTIAPKLWWELLSETFTDAAVGVFEADARERMS